MTGADLLDQLDQARKDRDKARRLAQEAMKLMTDDQLLALRGVVEGPAAGE
jgi:hypothetical protein